MLINTDKEYIICSAIWYINAPIPEKYDKVLRIRGFSPYNIDKGIVLCGWRHPNIMYQAKALFPEDYNPSFEDTIQGFLTSKNRFLNRKEAHKLFSNYGNSEYSNTELYSEDLY